MTKEKRTRYLTGLGGRYLMRLGRVSLIGRQQLAKPNQ